MVRAAAALVLGVHIAAAGVGLLSGAAALLSRKGGRLHRMAGNVFFVSIMAMSGIGAYVAPFLPRPQLGSVVAGVLTFYLVATSWVTVKRKEGSVGVFERGALFVAFSTAIAGLTLGLRSPSDAPPLAYFVFAGVAALAAALDLRMILRRGVSGAQRIARHLWRMCAALFITSASFFLGQQQVFPASVRGSPLLFAPEIVVLVLMVFWLVRLRFAVRFKSVAASPRALGAHARDLNQARGAHD